MRPPTGPYLIDHLFGLSFLTVRWYGVLIVSGAILAASLASRRAKARGIDPEHVWNQLLLGMLLGILGARIYYVAFELNANGLKRTIMDESTQRYREIRALLEQLVATWPVDRPGTAFENARVYLDFHCAECGARLSMNDLMVILELEMLRLGTVDTRRVPYYDPICIRCYIGQAAPICHLADHTGRAISVTSDGLLLDTRSAADAVYPPDIHLLPLHMTNDVNQADRANTAMLQDTHGASTTIKDVRLNRRSWWRVRSWHLIGAITLLVLISIVLLAFQPVGHALTTPMHPTPSAIPTNHHGAAIVSQPGDVLLAGCRG